MANDSTGNLWKIFKKTDSKVVWPTLLFLQISQSQTAGFVKVKDSLVERFGNMIDSKTFLGQKESLKVYKRDILIHQQEHFDLKWEKKCMISIQILKMLSLILTPL